MEVIRDYMAKNDLSQGAFARKVGVSQGMVWQWLTGYRPVSAESAVKIEKKTKGDIKRHQLRPDIFDKQAA